HLRQLLSSWGRAELSPDASVVVSELVTNAVAASRERRLAAASVLVWLGSDSCCLLLAVADASPRAPVRLNPVPDGEGGRGLALARPGSTACVPMLAHLNAVKSELGKRSAGRPG